MTARADGKKRTIVRAALLDVLDRLVPLAVALGRAVRTLALAGLAAAVVIALVVVARWLPAEAGQRVAVALLLAVAFVPPAVLLAFYLALRELAALPGRLRASPDVARQHAAELAALARGAQERGRPAWRRVPGSAWRLTALVRSSRDLLAPHASVLPFLSVPFLVATLAAAVATVVLVGTALGVVLVAILT